MLKPRVVKLNNKEVLVSQNQCVGYEEHLAEAYGILFLNGVIGNEFKMHNLLLALDSKLYGTLRLIITSPGGDLDSAFLLYDTIRQIKTPVETIGRYCASEAALILAAGSKRYVYPHAKVMLHLPSNYFQRDTVIPFQEMEIYQKESKKYKDRMINILQECGVKKNYDEILKDIDREYWLDSTEAIEYGLCDEILTSEVWQEWIK